MVQLRREQVNALSSVSQLLLNNVTHAETLADRDVALSDLSIHAHELRRAGRHSEADLVEEAYREAVAEDVLWWEPESQEQREKVLVWCLGKPSGFEGLEVSIEE